MQTILFKGEPGRPGFVGEPGKPGPKVRLKTFALLLLLKLNLSG